MSASSEGNHRLVSLREIATWQRQDLVDGDRDAQERLRCFRPGIPSLQRGAVWKPRQIEMLWDSLMRGFPIGAFITCEHAKDNPQKLREGTHAESHGTEEYRFTHQLLDGQQRANAIALGFLDPFVANSAGLWLDLQGESAEDRRYLFRVTTKAHPWGYDKDFNKLNAGSIRDALGIVDMQASQDVSLRKQAFGFWPVRAELPVPVAWLFDPAMNLAALKSGPEVLSLCLEKAKRVSSSFYNRLIVKLENATLSDAQWKRTADGMLRLSAARLIALEVAGDVLKDADGETTEDQSSNVEHLFTRLNSGGTILDGTELAYSLIKAYWPEIEAKIAALPRVDVEARLASLAFRDALSTDPYKDGFVRNLKIARIRRLAATDESIDERSRIRSHLGIGRDDSPAPFPFQRDLRTLKDLLDWSPQHPYALHPYLRNDLLGGNPELVLLLLHIVRRFQPSLENKLHRRMLLAIATSMHWFAGGTESDRRYAADQAAVHIGEGAGWESFQGILGKCHQEGKGILPLVSPDNLEQLIPIFDASLVEFLKARSDGLWTFWRALASRQGDTPKDWPFLERLKSLRRLLVYSQRAYMGVQFADFDTTDAGAWEDHNRPWDYDHILPQSVLYNMKRDGLVFKKTADEWLNSIGNLRAWPLSGNRSRQDETAEATIRGDDIVRSILTEIDVKAFSRKTDDFAKLEQTLEFLNAARARMFRMYRDWYETLEIGFLVGSADSPSPKTPGNIV